MATSATTFAKALPDVIARLQAASSIVVISHYNPDADAYGSSCGLGLALRAWGKQVQIVNENGVQDKYRFIPGVEEVLTLPQGKVDLFLVCDCGDAGRVGDSLGVLLKTAPVVNIDHRTSNDQFGAVNLVDETASSTSELVLRLLQAAKIQLSTPVASALLAGIVADTGSFRYSSTAVSTFEASAVLMRAGANPHAISEELFSRNSLTSVRLHAEALASLELLASGGLCILRVPEEMAKRLGASPDDSEGLVEKGRDIEGVKVCVLMRWVDGIWRISLRSRNLRWNVSEIATKFGGGGHKVAAAFRWRRSQADLEAHLLPALEALVNGGSSATPEDKV